MSVGNNKRTYSVAKHLTQLRSQNSECIEYKTPIGIPHTEKKSIFKLAFKNTDTKHSGTRMPQRTRFGTLSDGLCTN